MLPRVLEPEVMDTEEEAREYDEMDHDAVNAVFVEDLLFHGTLQGPVLDLGTGTALIPVALCRRAPSARIVAIDLAETMLARARRRVQEGGCADRVELRRVDAKGLPFADASFATVMSNSIVHHIPEPAVVLRDALRVLRPGGLLFVRDLLRPGSDARVRELVRQHASGASEHQRFLFDASLRAALTLAEIRSLVADLGLRPEQVKQSSDRHWTLAARRPGGTP